MQLEISTRHGHLSEPTQEKLRTKVEKLSRFFERLTSIEVVVDLKEADNPRVDIKVSAEHKHDFASHDQSGSLWGSVDIAVQKLEQQLRKYKQKVQDKHRNRDVRRQEVAAEPEGEE